MSYDSKVVSFSRNASYLHQRAMKNRRAGSCVDALELFRQAVKREPDNMGYALDMAELCSEMGLIEQSSRMLMHAMTRGNALPECLYSMALNLYRQGEISRAERVLRAYIEQDAPCEHKADASRLLDEILIARECDRPSDRKLCRAMRMVDLACAAMRTGDTEMGEKWFRRAIETRDYASEVHALLALALYMCENAEEARAEVERCLEMVRAQPAESGVKALCISAQVLGYLGESERALSLLHQTYDMETDESGARIRINAMCEMGLHDEVSSWITRLLADRPYDKSLLHAASVAAYNAEKPAEEVLRGWQRIARLDPDDPVCAYFIKAYQEGALLEKPMEYAYTLPREEVLERVKYLSDCVADNRLSLADAWTGYERFRSILEWELLQGSDRLARTAITVLSGIDHPEARALLRVYAERPDAPLSRRMYAITMMHILNIPEDMALRESFMSAGMPSEEEALSGLSVGQKQMIRYAAEYVEDKYGGLPTADIALIWRAYLESREGNADPIRRSEAGSAALAMCYLNMRGHDDDIFTVSRWYACPPRQAAHIARRIRDSLKTAQLADLQRGEDIDV